MCGVVGGKGEGWGWQAGRHVPGTGKAVCVCGAGKGKGVCVGIGRCVRCVQENAQEEQNQTCPAVVGAEPNQPIQKNCPSGAGQRREGMVGVVAEGKGGGGKGGMVAGQVVVCMVGCGRWG